MPIAFLYSPRKNQDAILIENPQSLPAIASRSGEAGGRIPSYTILIANLSTLTDFHALNLEPLTLNPEPLGSRIFS
jgi:hypothetical protein